MASRRACRRASTDVSWQLEHSIEIDPNAGLARLVDAEQRAPALAARRWWRRRHPWPAGGSLAASAAVRGRSRSKLGLRAAHADTRRPATARASRGEIDAVSSSDDRQPAAPPRRRAGCQQLPGMLAIGLGARGARRRHQHRAAGGRGLGEADRLRDRRVEHRQLVAAGDVGDHRAGVVGAAVVQRRQHAAHPKARGWSAVERRRWCRAAGRPRGAKASRIAGESAPRRRR